MRTIATILVLFLIQCTYLRAALDHVPVLRKITDSCIFGVKSVSLYLYNSNVTGEMVLDNELCNNIDPSQPVFFLVHGFTSYANSSNTRDLAMQLKHKGTVFALDWSQAACKNGIPILRDVEYPSAVGNTREIGHRLAEYTITLIKCGVPLEKITYIGHSLGAHVCGFAGKNMTTRGFEIELIIGADPARPLYSSKDCEERLCESDAKRVVILHTSPLGISYPIGVYDLYFNGGSKQPGCGMNLLSCPHSRSMTYFTIMLRDDCGFLGIPDSSSSYPDSDTDCIIVNSNILDSNNSIQGKYDIFVDERSYCTKETFNCKQ